MPCSRTLCIVVAMMLFSSTVGSAQTVKTIHNFGTDAEVPSFVLLAQGRDGKLYGSTATTGMPGAYGTVFRLNTPGAFKVLYTFDITGYGPSGGVTLVTDGNYYGVNDGGGTSYLGELFRITSSGVVTVLHSFTGGTDGSSPLVAPIEASDGNLYGVTAGALDDNGTVYKYDHAGNYSVIHSFGGPPDGSFATGIMQANDGNLYVTTLNGGTAACGAIVKMTTNGTVLHTHSFPGMPGGCLPYASLIQASDGNLYGTTYGGGSNGVGTLYRLASNGAVTVLHNFGASGDAVLPIGSVVQATDGNLYGTGYFGGVNNTGAIFQYQLDGTYSVLYSFPASSSYYVSGSLMQHTNGTMYGTSNVGGTFSAGTAFSLNMGLGPFVALVKPTGKTGDTAQILGQGLTGATSVTFNGVAAASFAVVSDTYMTAVVPSGASTGPVVVTTPTGTLASNKNFRITN